MLKILVSSSGKKTSLIKSMKEACFRLDKNAKIFCGDCSSNAISAYLEDEFWLMPTTFEENLDNIIKGCVEREITAVLPTRDDELLFWARNVDRFSEIGINVIVSPPNVIETCIDKLEFSTFGIDLGLPFIPAYLSPDNSFLEGRIVVKERFGAGAKNIGIDLDYEHTIEHSKKLKTPIFQPYIKGVEISVDAWVDKNHSVKGVILRKRNIVADGESKVTTTFRDFAIEKQAQDILEVLGLQGPVVLQALITSNGKMEVIECNARFGGASTASIAAGLDSLYWSLLEVQNIDVNKYSFNRIPGELCKIRIESDIYHHC